MNTRKRRHLLAACAAGAALAATTVLPSPAVAEPGDDADVQVTVDIDEIDEPGVLAMSIAGDAVALSENGSTLLVRQFVGTLPTVTVTDTRDPDEVPEGAAWAVLGSATDFVGAAGQEPISAGHLGWKPRLLDGGDTGLVTEGEEVVTVLDEETQPGNNVGLVDQELLVSTFDSEAVVNDAYSVDADLYLRTPADVAAGEYASVLTLSLFE
ncbi:twin-arginine translocation signal domain-containing protein [Plantactinospora solaniradicis]|uniref:Twin-arginine translocation signal domain-containing protein n=1 Tax=Plantactinospora solaniradicis TaxID=1723736 RepID=A0ABW1KNV6_9ACTN